MEQLKILKNNFGVYYIGDTQGNGQYYDFKVLASEDKKYLKKILNRINNGTIKKMVG